MESSTMLAINGAGSTRGFYRGKPKGGEIIQQTTFYLIFKKLFLIFFFREIRTVFQQSPNFSKLFQFYFFFFFIQRNQNCFPTKPQLIFTKTNRKQVRAEGTLAGRAQRSAHGFSCESLHFTGSGWFLSVQVLLFPSGRAGTALGSGYSLGRRG